MNYKKDDCLHCDIWKAIENYTERHPDENPVEMFTALASVIGDALSLIPGDDTTGRMLALVREQINEQFWYIRNQGQERRH